jgi:hypothetical protein
VTATSRRLCYIHVGTHKTGTTSLQAFLRDNESLFRAHGVLIPRSGRGNDAAGHHNLSQELLGGQKFCPERGGLADLAAELTHSEKQHACISAEDLSLASRSRETLRSLRDAIVRANYTPIIVVYLRPQVSYAVSMYAEIVKNGNRTVFRSFLRDVLDHGSFLWNGSLGPLFRYDILLERFADVFGGDAIVVRRYRSSAPPEALLRSFARLIVGAPIDARALVFPPERFNPSLSFPRVLRKLGNTSDWIDMRFAPLGLREMLMFAAPFFRGNLEVARRYGVWVPPFELRDLLLALPLRKSVSRTKHLADARLALQHADTRLTNCK